MVKYIWYIWYIMVTLYISCGLNELYISHNLVISILASAIKKLICQSLLMQNSMFHAMSLSLSLSPNTSSRSHLIEMSEASSYQTRFQTQNGTQCKKPEKERQACFQNMLICLTFSERTITVPFDLQTEQTAPWAPGLSAVC